MLALITYIGKVCHFSWVDCIISYKRGLLFCYCDVGEFPDASMKIIDN